MNATQPPLKPVMDLLEHVRENRVLQVSGQPAFSVQSALNILSGLDTEHNLTTRSTTRTEKIKQMLGWAPDPQYSVLRGIDEAALNWAHNEGYFDQPLHVHVAPPVPGDVEPVQIGADNILIVRSPTNGALGVLPNSNEGSERVFMLYIQATHEQLARNPVLLSQSGLSLQNETNIIEWGLAAPGSGMDVGSFVLRKTFSEAYAALVLLIGENGSEHAQTAVTGLIKRNERLQRVWDGERDIDQHHMGSETLRMVLDNWSRFAGGSADQARTWVAGISGAAFGSWLNDQPLAEIVVGELIPNFEKRVIDIAGREQRFIQKIPQTSLLKTHLERVHDHLQSQWDPVPFNTNGAIQMLHRTIQRTGLAIGWMVNHDPVLEPLAQRFEQDRTTVCDGIVAQLKGVAPNSRLSERLEQYRKGTTTEPYVLPPIP